MSAAAGSTHAPGAPGVPTSSGQPGPSTHRLTGGTQ